MPTVEIASLNSKGLDLRQEDFAVAILEENLLKSHRPRFFDLLQKEKGTIVHIGNPEFKDAERNIFFAGEIIDWEFEPVEMLYVPILTGINADFEGGANQQFRFKFLSQFRSDIEKLLRTAMDKSPIKKCYFFTDYYLGPENERRESIRTLRNLWMKHDFEGLVFNTLYELC